MKYANRIFLWDKYELSNFVHGTNSNFFQKTEYVDEFKFVNTTLQVFNITNTIKI